VGAKFACAEVRSAYAAASRIAFKFGKIFDSYHHEAFKFYQNFTRERISYTLALALSALLNSIKFNARHRILKFTAFFAL
jgi:hypothetical protein